MTEHRRLSPPGATYFFTVRLEQRGSTLLTDHVDALRYAYAKAVQDFPVTCHAMVVLPDHLHAIWTEPAGQVWYCERWRRIKARFTHAVAPPNPAGQNPALQNLTLQSPALQIPATKRDAGPWQRRFDECAIRDEDAFRRAMDYCRMNAVKHGLVTAPDLWPYSSFTKRRLVAAPPHRVTDLAMA